MFQFLLATIYYFRILKFFKVYKWQKKTTYKSF